MILLNKPAKANVVVCVFAEVVNHLMSVSMTTFAAPTNLELVVTRFRYQLNSRAQPQTRVPTLSVMKPSKILVDLMVNVSILPLTVPGSLLVVSLLSVLLPQDFVPRKIPVLVPLLIVLGEIGPNGAHAPSLVALDLKPKLDLRIKQKQMEANSVLVEVAKAKLVLSLAALWIVPILPGRPSALVEPVVLETKPERELLPPTPAVMVKLVVLWLTPNSVPPVSTVIAQVTTRPEIVSVQPT
jgi:hypothetical protein